MAAVSPDVTPVLPTSDLAFIADPYPVYAELRQRTRIVYDPVSDHWVVPHHADVGALLRDRRFGRTYHHLATDDQMGRPAPSEWHGPFWHLIRSGILDMEPPDHSRVRGLVSKAFTPRMVEGLRPKVAALMEAICDAVAGAGRIDLISLIAEPLPVAVIAEMLGVPDADRGLLRPWSADICRMYELHPTEEDARVAVRASVEFSEYLRELSRERRARPRDDLISGLAHAVEEGERLTEDELIGTCVLLLNAGHEATVNVTGNGWWALFRNPSALARLRADPALARPGIEELMRFDTPLQLFERWVLEDTEVLGQEIGRGAELGLVFGSGNRDPAVFDRPDELVLDRHPNPHLSFGAGIHFCLGAPLARIELETSFRTVLERFPSMVLAEEPEWKPNYIIRGLKALYVEGV